MKHRSIDKKTELYEFSDILDFVEYGEVVPDHYYAKAEDDNEWCGGTFKDAVKQAKTGNPELVKDLFKGANVISAMIDEEKVGEIRDVTGEYFDVADYLSGEPEVFRRDEYGDRKPVIPIYANFGMSCRISTDIIKNRGCAIVSLCDELCRRGFIVDLHLVEAVDYNRKKWMTNIAVRLDPLDLDTVAFIIANPLCLRRLWFAAFERYTGEAWPLGHGSTAEYVLDDIFESGLSGFYFVSSSHICFDEDNFRSLEKAKDHIMSMVEKFKESAEQVILG